MASVPLSREENHNRIPAEGELHIAEPPLASNRTILVLLVFTVVFVLLAAIFSSLLIPARKARPDTDGDGIPDIYDEFPDDPQEWRDLDGDGVGDNADAFPHDPQEWKDTDGDGIGDQSDPHPTEVDGPGVPFNGDYYPKGDAGLYIRILSFEISDPVDFFDNDGEIYLHFVVDGVYEGRTDEDSGFWSAPVGALKTIDKKFPFNLGDKKRYHNITIEMFDSDVLSEDLLDIDGTGEGRSLQLRYDLMTRHWDGEDDDGYADGSQDGTQDSDDGDVILMYDIQVFNMTINRTFEWNFDGKDWKLDIPVPPDLYYDYHFRSRTSRFSDYVTSNDTVIRLIANALRDLTVSAGYDDVLTANFVLTFVQSIEYSYDIYSTQQQDYWRFPVETIVDETGDCEDTSFLYASLLEASGFDAVLFLLPGHIAVGVAGNFTGWYDVYNGTAYYYAETTAPGWQIGIMPGAFHGDEVQVVQVK